MSGHRVATLFAVSGLLLLVGAVHAGETQQPAEHWQFEAVDEPGLHGSIKLAEGVAGRSLVFSGESLIVVPDSAEYAKADPGFSVLVWVNPYRLDAGQQMIVSKNCYARDQRQWGLMIDHDNKFRLYARQGDWVTAAADVAIRPGNWYQLGVVVRPGQAQLYVNGQPAGSIALEQQIANTPAPFAIGGVNDAGRIRQTFRGAIDEVQLFDKPLTPSQIADRFHPVRATHDVPKHLVAGVPLWDPESKLPKAEDVPELQGTTFHVIKPHEPDKDGGYGFLHGVALAWHKGKLYASWGHNRGKENTASEEARGRVSTDGGKTWGPTFTIDAGDPAGDLAVSHGVFLSHQDKLWAFMGAFHGNRTKVHTRAYVLDEETGRWDYRGIVVKDGFWPMEEPVRMDDGNWIMGGLVVGDGEPAAVAISRGDDLTKWDMIAIPRAAIGRMWGESTTFVDGSRVVNIARFGSRAQALAAVSNDFGRSWTASRPSNLPMATSKPYAGTLSTGQRYLVCTTTANSGGRRSPLTIAVSRPGENLFSRVYTIRDAEFADGPGDSHPKARLSYPYAMEHEGALYVGYSNNGARPGMNINSAELAIIPLDQLRGN